MTELPVWAVAVVTFGTPLSALAGVLISQWLARRTAKETQRISRREELMRNLRWAAELAAGADERKVELGVAQLVAWGESDLLDPSDQRFVDTALASVIRAPREAIEAIEAVGAEVEVVEVVQELGDTLEATDEMSIEISSDPGASGEEVGDDIE